MEQATKPALTPPEILRSAYQAEAGGQVAYAVQFYRHLVDYYGRTPEAAEALSALRRLGQAGEQVSGGPISGTAGKPLSEALGSPSKRPAYAAPPMPPRQTPLVRQETRRETAQQPRRTGRRSAEVSQKARGYKLGRSLAVLMMIVGWLSLAVAIGMSGMNLAVAVGVIKVVNIPSALRETLPVLAGLFPAGFLLLLLGQVFLAIFRTANATATLVAALHEHTDDDNEHG